MKLSDIDKATRDKPDHKPLDPDQGAVLVILHKPTGRLLRTWGWTLNQVIAILEWTPGDVRATFKRPWVKSRGAVCLGPWNGLREGIDKLNEIGG